MARILKRAAAKRDLIAQWVWYAENAGIETADRFLVAAETTLAVLASQPESGMRTLFDQVRLKEMRRFPLTSGFDRILLFYFPLEDGIDLVRVVHASRDLEGLLAEGFFG